MSCCAISTSSPVSTTTGKLRLSPTDSRSGEESSSLSTPPLSRPSMQEAARGATNGARSARPSASLAQARSAPTPSSCVLRGAASLCSPSRSQDAGAQRLSSSSVICPAAEPGPRRPTCGPAALQRGVQRWSGLLAFAAARSCARSFAASLLSLPLHGTANVDGPLPDLSDGLAEHRLDSPPHASRLPGGTSVSRGFRWLGFGGNNGSTRRRLLHGGIGTALARSQKRCVVIKMLSLKGTPSLHARICDGCRALERRIAPPRRSARTGRPATVRNGGTYCTTQCPHP